jgi:hypothetical protein
MSRYHTVVDHSEAWRFFVGGFLRARSQARAPSLLFLCTSFVHCGVRRSRRPFRYSIFPSFPVGVIPLRVAYSTRPRRRVTSSPCRKIRLDLTAAPLPSPCRIHHLTSPSRDFPTIPHTPCTFDLAVARLPQCVAYHIRAILLTCMSPALCRQLFTPTMTHPHTHTHTHTHTHAQTQLKHRNCSICNSFFLMHTRILALEMCSLHQSSIKHRTST